MKDKGKFGIIIALLVSLVLTLGLVLLFRAWVGGFFVDPADGLPLSQEEISVVLNIEIQNDGCEGVETSIVGEVSGEVYRHYSRGETSRDSVSFLMPDSKPQMMLLHARGYGKDGEIYVHKETFFVPDNSLPQDVIIARVECP